MKDLSDFVKREFSKKTLFEHFEFIDTIEGVDSIINTLNTGIYVDVKFKNSNLKNYFFDKLTTTRPEANIINCNCSIERYNENNFNGLIIFNNINKCHYIEILEDINKYKKSIKVY